MTSSPIKTFTERTVSFVLVVLLVIVLVQQARSLYIFPQPDAARWWGDETGQMLELRSELQDGVARIPTGLGSSVAVTNGLVRGNSWLAAALYGFPAILFPHCDVVFIGRTVTFILSLALMIVLFGFLRSQNVPAALALFALLLLVSTRSFFFSSHAARLDVAAGLTVLAYTWYFAIRFERLRQGRWEPNARWYLGYGAIAVLLATLSIHLLTLVGALSLYLLWRFQTYRNAPALFAVSGGVIAMLALLISAYALSGAPVSLFGPSTSSNQFQSVAGGLPILRPFSRSVQIANILERWHGLMSEAPAFLGLLASTIIIGLSTRRSHSIRSSERWLFGAAITVAIAWLFFESPALYYFVQVLPLFIVALITVIASRLRVAIISSVVMGIVGLCLCYFALRDSAHAAALSEAIHRDNYASLHNAIDKIEEDSSVSRPPIVLAQNPAIALLDHNPNVRLMTAHLVSFPVSQASIADVLKSLNVQFLLLYAARDGKIYSADEHALRPVADSLGVLIMRQTGTLFDVDRDYFRANLLNDTALKDTLLLYKFPAVAR